MSEIICPKCKGEGRVIDHEDGIFTLGLGYLYQFLDKDFKKKCDLCKGKKKIYLKN